jgi:hypothetical protein
LPARFKPLSQPHFSSFPFHFVVSSPTVSFRLFIARTSHYHSYSVVTEVLLVLDTALERHTPSLALSSSHVTSVHGFAQVSTRYPSPQCLNLFIKRSTCQTLPSWGPGQVVYSPMLSPRPC